MMFTCLLILLNRAWRNKLINDVVKENYTLLHGDCLERMKEIPDGSVDLVLVDLLGVM